jgi:hypothetical protein
MFSVDAMLARARDESGLDDFGSGNFLEGLTQLVNATNRGMKLGATGTVVFQEEVNRLLVNLLRFAHDLKRHPEILEEEIDDPIIILGLPRTGTTKLQRILAADPDTLSTKCWQTMYPAPIPGSPSNGEDPRIESCRQLLADLAQVSPGLMQLHPMRADYVDEEVFFHFFSFKCLSYDIVHPAPGYWEWVSTQSQRDAYEYMKQMLQYLQWQQGGRQGRQWVLKSPLHLGNLDLTAELFPRAKYIFTHRGLSEALPSFCRLTEMYWRIKMDEVDMHAVGRYCLRFWSREMDRHFRQRESLGAALDIYDVLYEDVKNDPFKVVKDIYAYLGREFPPRREQAMRAWSEADTHGSLGRYSYGLEQYGITSEEINEAFSEYQRYLSKLTAR